MSENPQHAFARHPRLGAIPAEITDAMSEGTLLHRLMLKTGPVVQVIEADCYRGKDAQQQRDEAVFCA